MEKLIIFGVAAMIGFFTFSGNKPWVTTQPHQEQITPCIEKPWVTPPPRPPLQVTPAIQ